MVTPDLIAASDAGQALFACCHKSSEEGSNFWDTFGGTSKLEKMQAGKVQQNSGTQLLVKILQERKKVETALMKGERIAIDVEEQGEDGDEPPSNLAAKGVLSHRAPFLAFLIHQRFASEKSPLVASSAMDAQENLPDVPEGAPETFAPYVRTLPSSICLPICWKRNELALLAGCIPGMPALQKVAADDAAGNGADCTCGGRIGVAIPLYFHAGGYYLGPLGLGCCSIRISCFANVISAVVDWGGLPVHLMSGSLVEL